MKEQTKIKLKQSLENIFVVKLVRTTLKIFKRNNLCKSCHKSQVEREFDNNLCFNCYIKNQKNKNEKRKK